MDLDITIQEKLKGILSKILAVNKEISLFVAMQKEDADTWDLIIGGNGLRTRENLDLIVKFMKEMFRRNEIVAFPRLILLNSEHPLLKNINKAFTVGKGAIKIEDTRINDILIKNAYLFYSKPMGYDIQKSMRYVVREKNVNIKDATTSLAGQIDININSNKY